MAHSPRPISDDPTPAVVPAAPLNRAVEPAEGPAFGIDGTAPGLDPCDPGPSLSRQP